MSRSIWKGPFVDGYLLKKADTVARRRALRGHQDLEPPLDDPAAVRRPDVRRLQRPQAHPGDRHRGDDRPQVRRVLADADLPRPRGRQEGEEGLIDGQAEKRRARWRTTRPRRSRRMLRVSPQKLNLAGAADPRQEGRHGAGRSRVLAQAHRASTCKKTLRERDRQRREQPRASTSTISSSPRPMSARRWCMKRFSPRARGRAGRIEKPFSQSDDRRARSRSATA